MHEMKLIVENELALSACARSAAAAGSAASAGDTSNTLPKTSFSAINAVAMPQLVRRKLRRLVPNLFAAAPASSFSRASNWRCCGVCGNGLNSPFDTIRVGTGERNAAFSANSVAASSRLLRKVPIA
jgi:hypothetical protein